MLVCYIQTLFELVPILDIREHSDWYEGMVLALAVDGTTCTFQYDEDGSIDEGVELKRLTFDVTIDTLKAADAAAVRHPHILR